MKKFFINKNEEVAQIIERVLADTDKDIIVVVPMDSILKESGEHFALLRRESEAGKKNVVIESVDEDILALAKKHHLDARHPLFHGDHSYSLSDIISEKPLIGRSRGTKAEKPTKHSSKKDDKENEVEEDIVTATEKEVVSYHVASPRSSRHEYKEEEEARPRRGRKALVYLGIFAVLAGAVMWGVGNTFGKATITLNFEKTPWSYDGAFIADKAASEIDASSRTIPAELLSQDRNITQLFPASGSQSGTGYATGRITIYNAFSTASQSLVVKTRFVTPDGKVFRLTDSVTIPGATKNGSALAPSSIEADVIADQPGSSYAIGPVDKLTIPGFQGTPKYDGFYGSLKNPTGIKVMPTDADITAAQKKVTDILQTSLSSGLFDSQSGGFKMLDGASSFQMTKLTVNKTTDAQGNFSVFGAATLKALAFKEQDLNALLDLLANGGTSTSTLKNLSVDFSSVKPDFTKGTLSFNAKAAGDLTSRIEEQALKDMITGKTLGDVRQIVLGISGIADAKMSLWPFWTQHLPKDEGKIEIIQK